MAPNAFLEIAAIELVVADIAVLPGPQHGQQVVDVLGQEKVLPVSDQKILKRGIAPYARCGAVRDRRPIPSRHRRAPSPASLSRPAPVPTAVVGGVAGERRPHAFEEYAIVA